MKSLIDTINESEKKHITKSEASKLSTVAKRFGREYVKNSNFSIVRVLRYDIEKSTYYNSWNKEGLGLLCSWKKDDEYNVIFNINMQSKKVDLVLVAKIDNDNKRIPFIHGADPHIGNPVHFYSLNLVYDWNPKLVVEMISSLFEQQHVFGFDIKIPEDYRELFYNNSSDAYIIRPFGYFDV